MDLNRLRVQQLRGNLQTERRQTAPLRFAEVHARVTAAQQEAAMQAFLGDQRQNGVPVDALVFASPQADKLATDEGLHVEDFEGFTPSGQRGFTLADVREIAKARDMLQGDS